MEAIYKSSGASAILLTDVGIRRRWPDGEVPARLPCNRYLRDTDLPTNMPPTLRSALQAYTGSIPDILMQKMDGMSSQMNYVIAEIKYCKDTDPEPQRQRAQDQHAALRELFATHDPDCRITVAPILLGVTGVIYKETIDTMEHQLGVEGPRYAELAKKLHFSAVTNMQKIWRQRKAIMTAARKCTGTRPAQPNPNPAKRRKHGTGEPDHHKKPRFR